MPRNFINWSCKLTLYQRERDGGGGQPPVKSEGRAQSNKVGRLWFLGGRCSRISGGTPEARSRLCVCRASFIMTFATGRVPHDGSLQRTTIKKKHHNEGKRKYPENTEPFLKSWTKSNRALQHGFKWSVIIHKPYFLSRDSNSILTFKRRSLFLPCI